MANRTYIKGKNNSVIINGKNYRGSTIIIDGDNIVIDGDIQESGVYGEVNIVVEGNVETIENSAGDIKANNVTSVSTQNGDITCNDVAGSVSTMNGNISAKAIKGNASSMNGNIYTK